MRVDRLRDAYDIDVRYIHFPLHPDTPAEGQTLEQLFAGRGYDLAELRQRMRTLMDAEGLPIGDRDMTYNSRLAQELGKWADTQPGGWAIHDALFRAYFVDGVNLADIDALVPVAERVGLPGDAARDALEQRSFREAVDADWQRSMMIGVSGVPTFLTGKLALVGWQPYEQLERLLDTAGVARRSAKT